MMITDRDRINVAGHYFAQRFQIPAPLWSRIIYRLSGGKFGKMIETWTDI